MKGTYVLPRLFTFRWPGTKSLRLGDGERNGLLGKFKLADFGFRFADCGIRLELGLIGWLLVFDAVVFAYNLWVSSDSDTVSRFVLPFCSLSCVSVGSIRQDNLKTQENLLRSH